MVGLAGLKPQTRPLWRDAPAPRTSQWDIFDSILHLFEPSPELVKPFDESLRKFAPSRTTPREALGESVDLIIVATGKS